MTEADGTDGRPQSLILFLLTHSGAIMRDGEAFQDRPSHTVKKYGWKVYFSSRSELPDGVLKIKRKELVLLYFTSYTFSTSSPFWLMS